MAQQNNDPINALPEYEVRTMKDDLDKLEGKTTEPKLISLKVPEVKPLSAVTSAKADEPPKDLPIILKPLPKKPLEIKKSSLPDIEDFIVPPKPAPVAVPKPIPTPVPMPMPAPVIPKPAAKPFTPLPIQENNEENDEIEKTIKAHKTKKLLTILGIIAIVVIIINIIGYLIITAIKSPEPIPLPTDNQPKVPASLIRVDETKILKITNNISLVDLLINEENSTQPEKTLKRIIPIKINNNVLTLNELTQELRIYIPPYTLAELKNSYTLVAYKQGKQQRIGLIVETNNLNNFIEKSKSWEQTMPWNFQGIFLNHQPNNLTTKGFSDNKYREINVRFDNLPGSELAIDYTILNNLFLMSTSEESIHNIIDRLK